MLPISYHIISYHILFFFLQMEKVMTNEDCGDELEKLGILLKQCGKDRLFAVFHRQVAFDFVCQYCSKSCVTEKCDIEFFDQICACDGAMEIPHHTKCCKLAQQKLAKTSTCNII